MQDRCPSSRTVLLLALGAALCVAPMVLWGYHEGADLNVHLDSWMDASQQFRQAIFFPRWAAEANYGFGEPRFIFYPPLSWMLGGTLGLVMRWALVPVVYAWLTLMLAGVAMWSCAREWFSPQTATMAAVLYAFNPSTISTIYNRSDFAELLASAFFPFLLMQAVRLTEGRRGALVPLAAAFAAIWLANFPAAVIATYALALLLLMQSVSLRSWQVLLRGAGAMLLGFGLAAFIVFPALWEQKWINIRSVIRPLLRPSNNFLFGPVAGDANMHRFNHKVSLLAVLLSVATVAAIFLARKWRSEAPQAWRLASELAVASIFMMLPLSLPLWRYLPKLQFVQFPWRWLLVLCVAGALLGAAAIAQMRHAWMSWLAIAIFLGALNWPVIRTTTWSFHPVNDVVQEMRSSEGYGGLLEYAPIGADISRIAPGAPDVTVSDAAVRSADVKSRDVTLRDVTWRVDAWSAQQKSIYVVTPEPLELNLKLLAYPAWRVTVNRKPEAFDAAPGTGEIEVRVPAGADRVRVVWTRTWDRTAGGIISLASITACLLILFFEKKTFSRPVNSRPASGAAENGALPAVHRV